MNGGLITDDLLSKDDFKMIGDIKNLSPDRVLCEILSYYTCPPECNGSCCRQFDIYYTLEDIRRISNSNKKYKRILKKLVVNNNPKKINGRVAPNDWMYPAKPCPFLKQSRCVIQNIKPECCKFFPFGVKEDTNVDHPSYPIMITLDRCYLGTDILIDFMLYHMFISQFNPDTIFNFEEYHELLLKEILNDKTNVKALYASQFYDFEQFRGFLLFIKTTTLDLYTKREEFKQMLVNERIKQLMINR